MLMFPLAHLIGVGARQHLGDLIDAEINPALLAQTVHTRKKFLGFERAVIRFARSETVITGPAVMIAELLAEVTQQSHPAALCAFSQLDHLPQLLSGDIPLLWI